MAAAQYYDVVQKMYVGYFGRPADPAGLQYWAEKLSANGGDLTAITTGFGNSAEAKALWGSLDTQVAIDTLYQQLFNRSAEPAGLIYWTNKIASGAETLATIARALVEGAQNDDVTTLAKKVAVAARYTDAADDTTANILAYKGDAAAAAARAQLKNVTKDTDAATFDVAAIVTAVAAGSTSGITGTTYTLTTAADNVVGTANNDTINGSLVYAAGGTTVDATSTFSLADIIDGGAGTDTLSLVVSGGNAGLTLPASTVSNIETLSLRNISGNTLTTDTSNFSGLTMVNSNLSTAANTLTNLASGVGVTVTGNGSLANGATTGTYVAGATAASLTVAGGVTAGAISLNGAGNTTMTINSTGASNIIGALGNTSTALTTVTINAATAFLTTGLSIGSNAAITTEALVISGAATNIAATSTADERGAVSLGTIDSDFGSVDASGLTAGGVEAILSATTTATFTGGAGNDIITTGAASQTGTVSGGAGTGDILIVADATHLDSTAEGAKYTNFEILSVSNNQDMDNVTGSTITAIEMTDGGNSVTNMTATQAAAITVVADSATNTLALKTATGTSDVLGVTLRNDTLSASADFTGLTITGFETMNVVSSSGSTADKNSLAFTSAGDLTALNISGDKAISVNTANITKAATITAATNTYSATTATDYGLTITGALATGSVVTGTATHDNMTLSTTTGTTYNGGAGNDLFNTVVASLVATGANDNKINGGEGTDTVTITDADSILTDNHFTHLSNVEKLAFTGAGAITLTTGAGFNTAFSNGVEIVAAANNTDAKAVAISGGLSTVNTKVSITTDNGGATTEDVSITTGSGADTVTIAAASFVGVAGADGGQLIVDTGAGNDTISVTHGVLVSNNTSRTVSIDAGTGADTITKVGTNDDSALGTTNFVVQDGDSKADGYDVITGFDLGTATLFSDSLDFDTANVQGNTAGTDGTDSGTIKSHAITNGIITFDDVDTFAAAVTINSSNLSSVLTYLATNISTAGNTVAFAYDKDGNGTNDGTFVFNQGTNDSVVELVGVVATSMSATNAATANLLAIG